MKTKILVLTVVAFGMAFKGCSRPSDGTPLDKGDSNPTADVAGNISETRGSSAGDPGKPAEKADPASEKMTCASCHEEQSKFNAYGGHASLSCRKCHGVTGDHNEAGIKPDMPGNKKCLKCHSLVKGPKGEKMSEKDLLEHHIRFVEKKHVVRVNREKVKNRCIHCHDPHLGQ